MMKCINCGYASPDADSTRKFVCACGWKNDPTTPTLFKFNAVKIEGTKS